MYFGTLEAGGTKMVLSVGNEKNELLKQEIARDAGDVSICLEAVELNLIAGSGARTICLTVPQDSGAVTAELRNASTGWVTGNQGE